MNFNFSKILYILISCTLVFTQSDLNELYDQGLNAYKNAQFNLAIQKFNTILENDWESPELYYNLGNAYYQLVNISGAVWAYEQCIKLDPMNKDALFNLQLTNLKVKDRIDIPDPPVLLKLFRILKEMFTTNGWIQLWGVMLVVLSSIIAIRKIFNIYSIKILEIIWSILFILLLIPGGFSILESKTIQEGIISAPKVNALSAPNSYSTQLFNVHEGLKVEVNEISNNWVEIELMDGKIGWIESSDIRMLSF